jgi:hypothetical protein
MKSSTEQKKAKIAKAIHEIVETGVHDYQAIADMLNSRKIKMMKGSQWNMDTARRMAIETGENYARDKLHTDKRDKIIGVVNVLLASPVKMSMAVMAEDMNNRGIKTLRGFLWTDKNMQCWVNNHAECRTKHEARQTVMHKRRSIGMLNVMVTTKELKDEVVQDWGNYAARAAETILNLKSQGV